MKIIYTALIAFYIFLVRIASIKNQKAHKMIKGRKNLLSQLKEKLNGETGYIWIHAASLGEFEQGRPLIEALKKRNPKQKILLTFFSPSGYDVRKNYPLADYVCYLPFDLPSQVNKFLDIVQPSQVLFVKYDFWANFIIEITNRKIPLYLVSGIFRPTQHFFRPTGSYSHSVLRRFTHLFVQDNRSKELLATIGVTQVTCCGDTRLDRVIEISKESQPLPLIQAFVSTHTTTFIVGSSWQADEAIYAPYLNAHPEIRSIIAPHEIDEHHLQQIEHILNGKCVRYTHAKEADMATAQHLIIDCFGLLSTLYRYGDIAYIGGGFGAGIHNVPEAAVYGIPILFGPRYNKFKEATDLITIGGAFSIHDTASFESIIDKQVNDLSARTAAGNAAHDYILQNAGATDTVLNAIFK